MRRAALLLPVAAAVLVLAGCGASGPSNPTTAAATGSNAPAATSTSGQVDRELCKVTGADGAYYLQVTSAVAHNFAACAGATVLPAGTDVLSLAPGMDRRCMSSDADVASDRALIAVYSGTGADLAAAAAYCKSHGWTNN